MTDIHGYVIISKETGERWGSCFDTIGGAKTSWHGTFCRRTGFPPSKLKHLAGKKFDDQDEYVIKPLVIYESE